MAPLTPSLAAQNGPSVSGTSTFWRRLVIYLHRWLGIAGSLLFLSWFVSGIVLMYAGMPELTRHERLLGAPPLDLGRATVGVNEAAVQAGFTPSSVLVGMHGDRPVYRFSGANGWSMFYADTGTLAGGLSDAEAVAVVRQFNPTHADPTGPLRGRRLQVQLPAGAIKGAGDGLMAASRGGAALKLDYAGVYGYTPHAAL